MCLTSFVGANVTNGSTISTDSVAAMFSNVSRFSSPAEEYFVYVVRIFQIWILNYIHETIDNFQSQVTSWPMAFKKIHIKQYR